MDKKYLKITIPFIILVIHLSIGINKIYAYTMATDHKSSNTKTIISDILGIPNNIDPYINFVEKEVTKDGLTVILEEVILSSEKLIVAYTVNSEIQEYQDIILPGDAWVNDQRIVGSETYNRDWDSASSNLQIVTSYRFDKSYLTDDAVSLNLKLSPEMPNGKRLEEFCFELTVPKEKLVPDVSTIRFNHKIEITDSFHINLSEISLNLIETSIKGSCEYLPLELSGYPVYFYLSGKDSIGNSVLFVKNSYLNPDINWVVDKPEHNVSLDSEYLDLQLYAYCLSPDDNVCIENDYVEVPMSDDEIDKTEETIKSEFTKETLNIADPFKPFPLGEEFRIQMKDEIK